MEKIGEDRQEEELKAQTAIRCAKAAVLLSSLKNVTNTSTINVPQLQDEEKIMLLKIELVKEKQKLKKLRHWMGVSLLSYFLIVLLFPLVLNFL
ncbi:hypothetical protein Pfo_021823 [Paulownia fortunei]|nr:hypothetical protein Pfo_021823 [Paulownia fortunei]